MKEFLVSRFKGRSAGFYIGFAAAALILAFDIAYITALSGDRNFSALVFALMLAGSLLMLVYSLLNIKLLDFIPAVSCILYGVGFGQHLILALESLSDVWNEVNFVGGNATLGAVFMGLFFVPMVVAVVAAFMHEERAEVRAEI